MITLTVLNLVTLFLLVIAVSHGNWIGAAIAVFFFVVLWLWAYRKIDLPYEFRKPRVWAFVIVAACAVYVASEIFHGCAVVLDTESPPEDDRPLPQRTLNVYDE